MASIPELIALAEQALGAYQRTNLEFQSLRTTNEAVGTAIAACEEQIKKIIERTQHGVTSIQGDIQKVTQAHREARGATLRAFSNSATGTAGPKISGLSGIIETRINECNSMLEGAKAELAKIATSLANLDGARQSLLALNGRADQGMTTAGAQIQAAQEAISKLRSV